MQITQISDRVEQLARAWEQFKSLNDTRLASLEKKKAGDPMDLEQLGRISATMDEYKSRLNMLESAVNRPELSTESAEQSLEGKSFQQYLRSGIEVKTMSVGSDSDGGYLITPQMSKQVIKHLNETSLMRRLAAIETISTDALDLLEDLDHGGSGWVGETETRSDTTTPKLNRKKIMVHEMYAQPKATQQLIDDANIDISSWLAEKIAESFTNLENQAFLFGDGKGKPKGILNQKAGREWGSVEYITSSAGKITADDLFNLYYALPSQYSAKASFVMHRNQLQQIRMLKDSSTGQYIWNPGLALGAPDTLLSAPVYESLAMPLPEAGNTPIIFADFKQAYKIVDRHGIRILRDPFTDKPFVKFYATKRTGGDVINYHAVKLLKIAK